jgi:hypothetical protein
MALAFPSYDWMKADPLHRRAEPNAPAKLAHRAEDAPRAELAPRSDVAPRGSELAPRADHGPLAGLPDRNHLSPRLFGSFSFETEGPIVIIYPNGTRVEYGGKLKFSFVNGWVDIIKDGISFFRVRTIQVSNPRRKAITINNFLLDQAFLITSTGDEGDCCRHVVSWNCLPGQGSVGWLVCWDYNVCNKPGLLARGLVSFL